VRMFEAMPKGQAIAAGLAGAFILTEISNTILCSGGEKVRACAVLQPPSPPPSPASASASSIFLPSSRARVWRAAAWRATGHTARTTPPSAPAKPC
jgi:hypothetical protein